MFESSLTAAHHDFQFICTLERLLFTYHTASERKLSYHGRMNSCSIGATSCGHTSPRRPIVIAVTKCICTYVKTMYYNALSCKHFCLQLPELASTVTILTSYPGDCWEILSQQAWRHRTDKQKPSVCKQLTQSMFT